MCGSVRITLSLALLLMIVSCAARTGEHSLASIKIHKINGIQTYCALDGSPFTGTITDRYPDGVIRQIIPVENGTVNGQWKTFYRNGSRTSEEAYKNGLPNGVSRLYREDGTLWSEGIYTDNVRDGVERWFHENGALETEIHYVQGKRHGTAREYDQNGTLILEESYEQGMLRSVRSGDLER